MHLMCLVVFFFKQKTAYEMRISDWSSDVCSSDLLATFPLLGSRNASCCAQTLAAFGDIDTRYVLRSDDNSTIQGCVTAGLGVALPPMLTIDIDDPTTTIVPVVPRVQPPPIAIAWPSGRRPPAPPAASVEPTHPALARAPPPRSPQHHARPPR